VPTQFGQHFRCARRHQKDKQYQFIMQFSELPEAFRKGGAQTFG
jgi:hypothetical protein